MKLENIYMHHYSVMSLASEIELYWLETVLTFKKSRSLRSGPRCDVQCVNL